MRRWIAWARALACTLVAVVAHAEPDAQPAQPKWEGAIGLLANYGPTYMGSATSDAGLRPGVFLRYGRFSATTAGGLRTRRNEDVERGLAANLLEGNDYRIRLSARMDGGRDADSDPAFAGLPDIKPTLRLRLSLTKSFDQSWKFTLGLNPDLLRRGGGALFDASLSYDWQPAPSVSVTAQLGTVWADSIYTQSYFGITPEESISSGLPTYFPGAGFRDLSFGVGSRVQIAADWFVLGNAFVTRLLGGAQGSPLTHRTAWLGVGGGLAWQF